MMPLSHRLGLCLRGARRLLYPRSPSPVHRELVRGGSVGTVRGGCVAGASRLSATLRVWSFVGAFNNLLLLSRMFFFYVAEQGVPRIKRAPASWVRAHVSAVFLVHMYLHTFLRSGSERTHLTHTTTTTAIYKRGHS